MFSLEISDRQEAYQPLPPEKPPLSLIDLPKDVFSRILFFCSLQDEVTLSLVSKKTKILVLKVTQQKTLFRVINEIVKLAPKVDYKPRIWDRVNYIARHIEIMPFGGTPLAITRCISGLSVALFFGMVQYVRLKQLNRAETLLHAEIAKYKLSISKDYTRRSVREMLMGAINIVPFVGLFTESHYTERHFSPMRMYAIHMFRGIISNLNWLNLMKSTILESFPSNHKTNQLMDALARVAQMTLQLNNVKSEFAMFSDPKTANHHIPHFYERCNTILEMARLVNSIAKETKLLLAKNSIKGV